MSIFEEKGHQAHDEDVRRLKSGSVRDIDNGGTSR